LVGAQRKRHHSSISTAKKVEKNATQMSLYPQAETIAVLLTNLPPANDKNEETKGI